MDLNHWCSSCGNAVRLSFVRMGLFYCKVCVLRCDKCARPFNQGTEAALDRHRKKCTMRMCGVCFRRYDTATHPYCPFSETD
jgi:hypothetical protein